jgi:aminotransferase
LSAIGRVQLRKVDGFIKRREEIWRAYQEGLSDINLIDIPPEPLADCKSSYYLYWINVKDGERDGLAKYLIDNGIYCSYRYYPLHFIKQYGHDKGNLPNSEAASDNYLNIPLHQNLSNQDVERVIKTIKVYSKKC